HVEVALHPHQGGEEPDGTRAGNEQYLWLPRARPMSDALDVIPGLREDAGGLQQHAENAQFRIDLDGELRLDAEAFGAVAVPLLDAAFGVAPVAAHVPLADGAGNARLRFRDLLESRRAGDTGQNGDCTHRCLRLPRFAIARRRPRELFRRLGYAGAPRAVVIFVYAGRRKMFLRIETKTGSTAL